MIIPIPSGEKTSPCESLLHLVQHKAVQPQGLLQRDEHKKVQVTGSGYVCIYIYYILMYCSVVYM